MRDTSRIAGSSPHGRSSITNGSSILPLSDGRSAWARRFRDLLNSYESDLGGADSLSEGQRALARRAALLQVELEFQESRFARLREEGSAPAVDRLDSYGRASNTLRRLVQTLGLTQGRKPRAPIDMTGAIVEHIRTMGR